ncbi:hypothetical protein B0H17DRAFT_1049253 [Mycena rosella]|uniref:Protein CPL1-like domain-containing protein n=1 Tax=Mycena rosella TaxID=1033263 RepID=A0AAD7DUH1_MYCRO|nr:hypothetical protein B0H17DRAFT_1049253 [Mycena rosella]
MPRGGLLLPFPHNFLPMLRLLPVLFFAILSVEAAIAGANTNPCSSGALVYTRYGKCECRRRNGAMGSFRSGCKATPTPDLEGCASTCNTDKNGQSSFGDVCPVGTRACPVADIEFECVSPELDVDNCGGCVSTGEGVACGDYPGVRGAACVNGVCDVYSCAPGYALSEGVCVRRSARKREKEGL